MQYPEVKKAHIVPVSYLNNFAQDNQLGVRLVKDGSAFNEAPRNVGWRKDYYARTRPNGERIDDVEWAISQIEAEAAQVLREVEQRWPLSDEDKLVLAKFAALQLLRVPRFRAWQEEQLEKSISEMKSEEGLDSLTEQYGQYVGESSVTRVAEHLRSDTQQHVRVLALIGKIGSILGSMHWTLLRFRSPVIATSDHPIHVWYSERRSSTPMPARRGAGMLKTLEVRLPLSPRLALLMTWLPQPDPDVPTPGARHHPKNLNAFTVAEAEQHWFHLPDTKPPVGTEEFLPLSGDLYRGYDAATAWNSPLRQQVSRNIQPKIGADLADSTELTITRVRAPT